MKIRVERSAASKHPKGEQPKGVLRATGHVLKNVTQDPRSKLSAKRLGNSVSTIAKVGGGLAVEVGRNPKVQETAKNVGRFALITAGVARYDMKTGKTHANPRGIAFAMAFPELAATNAIIGARRALPYLVHDAALATPSAIKGYHKKNPGAFEAAGRAAANTAKELVVLPFHIGRSAIEGVMEVREANKAVRQASAESATAQTDITGFTIHRGEGQPPITVNFDSIRQAAGDPITVNVGPQTATV